MVFRRAILLASLAVLIGLIGLIGCSITRTIILHPIDKQDIFQLPKGTEIKIVEGSVWTEDGKVIKTWDEEEIFIIDRQSYSLSQYYLMEIVRTKVGK